MNFKQAAYHVLKDAGRPLSAKEITQIALKEGLITTDGKTPSATMGAVIYADIKQKKEKSLFVKVKSGLFGLREWDEEAKEGKDKTMKISPQVNLIIKYLEERQYDSTSPTNFGETLKNAFSQNRSPQECLYMEIKRDSKLEV